MFLPAVSTKKKVCRCAEFCRERAGTHHIMMPARCLSCLSHKKTICCMEDTFTEANGKEPSDLSLPLWTCEWLFLWESQVLFTNKPILKGTWWGKGGQVPSLQETGREREENARGPGTDEWQSQCEWHPRFWHMLCRPFYSQRLKSVLNSPLLVETF